MTDTASSPKDEFLQDREHPMRKQWLAVALAGALAAPVGTVGAAEQDFRMQETATLPALGTSALAPRTIVFTDHRNDELADAATGLFHFSDWERARPQQKQLLSLFPPTRSPRPALTIPASRGLLRLGTRLHVRMELGKCA